MAVTTAGYTDLRTYVEGAWVYMSALDDAGAQLGDRYLVGTDAEATLTSTAHANPVVMQLVLNGTDMGVNTKVQGLKFYKVATVGSSMVDITYASYFQFGSVDDELTLRESIQIPAL